MKILALVIFSLLCILSIRREAIRFALQATSFGCQTAALKERISFDIQDGNKLNTFCNERDNMYRKAYGF